MLMLVKSIDHSHLAWLLSTVYTHHCQYVHMISVSRFKLTREVFLDKPQMKKEASRKLNIFPKYTQGSKWKSKDLNITICTYLFAFMGSESILGFNQPWQKLLRKKLHLYWTFSECFPLTIPYIIIDIAFQRFCNLFEGQSKRKSDSKRGLLYAG